MATLARDLLPNALPRLGSSDEMLRREKRSSLASKSLSHSGELIGVKNSFSCEPASNWLLAKY